MWALLAAVLLTPQSAWERNYDCWDRGDISETCWADIRALYAASPIGQSPGQGMRIRRFFLLDLTGHLSDPRGNDTQAGMISIEQRGDGDPVLTYRPAGAAHALVTSLSREDWTAVLAATAQVPGQQGAICLHGWQVLVEAADPAASGSPAVRRYISTCEDFIGVQLADRLTDVLIHAFPRCGHSPRGDSLWHKVDWLYRCRTSGRGLP